MEDTTTVKTIVCPTCHRELKFVDYILRGGVTVGTAERLGKEQTVWEAVEYHCPYCNVELPKRLLIPETPERHSHYPASLSDYPEFWKQNPPKGGKQS